MVSHTQYHQPFPFPSSEQKLVPPSLISEEEIHAKGVLTAFSSSNAKLVILKQSAVICSAEETSCSLCDITQLLDRERKIRRLVSTTVTYPLGGNGGRA